MGANCSSRRVCTRSRSSSWSARSALPEVHAGAVPRGRPLERLSRRRPTRRTASRRRRCWSARRPTASSTGFTRSYLLPVNLYGPGDNFDETSARDPRPDPEDADGRRRGRALGRRLADAGVSLRRRLRRPRSARRRALRRARAGQPRHRRRDLHPRPRRARRRRRRLRGRIDLGHDDAERAAAPRPRCERARESSSAGSATTPLRDGLERTVAWYRSRRTAHAGA